MGLRTIASRATTCDHGVTVQTVNFGIRRVTCAECGRIDLGYEGPSEPGMLFRIPSQWAPGEGQR